MTRKASGPRSARPAAGKPLFGHREYPVNNPFRFLLWTEDRKGFREYHDGQSIPETEYGYSTKEELFLAECTSRFDRWRYDIVSEHATLWNILPKEQYQAMVISGEDLTSLSSRAIYYFDRVPFGPKTAILAFHKRPIEPSHLDRLWSFLKEAKFRPQSADLAGASGRGHWTEGEKGRKLSWERARQEWTDAYQQKYEKFLIDTLYFPNANLEKEPSSPRDSSP
jgi:hypothetical protein